MIMIVISWFMTFFFTFFLSNPFEMCILLCCLMFVYALFLFFFCLWRFEMWWWTDQTWRWILQPKLPTPLPQLCKLHLDHPEHREPNHTTQLFCSGVSGLASPGSFKLLSPFRETDQMTVDSDRRATFPHITHQHAAFEHSTEHRLIGCYPTTTIFLLGFASRPTVTSY